MAKRSERIRLLNDDPETREFIQELSSDLARKRATAAFESRQAEELSRLQRAGVDISLVRVLKPVTTD